MNLSEKPYEKGTRYVQEALKTVYWSSYPDLFQYIILTLYQP